MAIFNSYVKLPEGKQKYAIWVCLQMVAALQMAHMLFSSPSKLSQVTPWNRLDVMKKNWKLLKAYFHRHKSGFHPI